MSNNRADLPPLSTVPYSPYKPSLSPLAAAQRFYEIMRQRRSVRFFSDAPVSEEIIRTVVAAAGTAPSGANKQPWRFIAVRDPAVKKEIRTAAEIEEREFYDRRASPQWLADLAPLGTDWNKEYLEIAPWLIVVFKTVRADPDDSGRQGQVYYVNESVGIAVGLLLAAIQHAGLAALTHTPSPMGFLSTLLNRPDHERPFLLIPVGYPAPNCTVPDIHRKPLDQILITI